MDWSWNTVHLSEEVHEDRELLKGFLDWLNIQVSLLPSQVHLHKNQLQQLLLGLALTLRDHEIACFSEEDTPLPKFLAESCMEAADLGDIGDILERMFQIADDHVE